MSENDDGNPKYVFCIFEFHANDTAQTNYRRCCHANVSNIYVRYGGSVYSILSKNAHWNRNIYSRFYYEFIKVSKSLSNTSAIL